LVRCESLNVREVPGCRPQEYAKQLLGLFARNMVKLDSDIPEDDVNSAQGVSKILERFLSLSGDDSTLEPPAYEQVRLGHPAMKVSFALTQLGGQAWEELAQPRWSRFIAHWNDL
jgi:hypothetical protein